MLSETRVLTQAVKELESRKMNMTLQWIEIIGTEVGSMNLVVHSENL